LLPSATDERGLGMSKARLNEYIGAWLVHPKAGAEDGEAELQTLLNRVSVDIRYEDVPTGSVFQGHQGIRDMCAGAHVWSDDVKISVASRQTDGSYFAIESVVSGSNTGAIGGAPATGRPFSHPLASVGRFRPDGLVVEHRDYWDLMTVLKQIGTLPR
jgi:hypothetical protein